MADQQPEALRLALLLDDAVPWETPPTHSRLIDRPTLNQAAFELCRLHAVEQQAQAAIIRAANDDTARAREIADLRAQVERLQAGGGVVAYRYRPFSAFGEHKQSAKYLLIESKGQMDAHSSICGAVAEPLCVATPAPSPAPVAAGRALVPDDEALPPRKWVTEDRSYELRSRQIIAFNTCTGDLDDKLDAAHKVLFGINGLTVGGGGAK